MDKLFISLLISMSLLATEGILLPFYHYPVENDKEIEKLIRFKKEYPDIHFIAIINPNNGHFELEQYNFAYMIDRFNEANITTIGYVYTNYTRRDIEEVKKDIDHWEKIYKKWGVQGIFLDEVNGSQKAYPYYKELYDYIKQKFSFIVLNPGTKPEANLSKIADLVVVYESDKIPDTFWYEEKSALLLHSIKEWDNIPSQLFKYDYIYITEQSFPNPWERLSSYLEFLLKKIEKIEAIQ